VCSSLCTCGDAPRVPRGTPRAGLHMMGVSHATEELLTAVGQLLRQAITANAAPRHNRRLNCHVDTSGVSSSSPQPTQLPTALKALCFHPQQPEACISAPVSPLIAAPCLLAATRHPAKRVKVPPAGNAAAVGMMPAGGC
jgi:hypothetical protein